MSAQVPTKMIGSSSNPGFKLLREVIGSARARREHQAAWLEGERLCMSLIEREPAQAPILVASDAIALNTVPQSCRTDCKEIWLIDRKLFAQITQVETSIGWGLLMPISSWQKASFEIRPRSDIVVLDRVQDPGNAGSILRSAAAAGAQSIWCVSGTVDLWSPKVLRAGMGAHFVMDIRQDLQSDQVISLCTQHGISILATANSPQAHSLFDMGLPLHQPVAWVFGQEGSGVAADFMQVCTQVSIPQAVEVESLNVAAAAAVCLFESRRHKL